MSGVDGASENTDGAWADIERSVGSQRGDGDGPMPAGEVNDAPFRDSGSERSRVMGLASTRGQPEKIGIDPRFAEQFKAGAPGPRTTYDPRRRPDREPEPAPAQNAERFMADEHRRTGRQPANNTEELDQADVDFFGDPGAVGDDGAGVIVADDGQITMPQAQYDTWQRSIAANEVESTRLRQEKADMQAALGLMRTNPIGTMRALGVPDQQIQSQLEQIGLAAPPRVAETQPANAVFPEFGEDADPALRTLAETQQATGSRLTQLEDSLEGLVDRLERREETRNRQDYARTRAARLSGVKGHLSQVARGVPALKKHGSGKLLVDNVMFQLDRDFDRLPADSKDLNEQAVGMLRSAAVELGLGASAKAKAAKESSRRRAAPVPTTPGRVLRQPERQGGREEQFDFSNEEHRRDRGLAWLQAESERRSG